MLLPVPQDIIGEVISLSDPETCRALVRVNKNTREAARRSAYPEFHLSLQHHQNRHFPDFYRETAKKLGQYTVRFYIHKDVPICSMVVSILEELHQLEMLYLDHCSLVENTMPLATATVRAIAVTFDLRDTGLQILRWALRGCTNVMVLHILAGDECDWKSNSRQLEDDLARYRGLSTARVSLRCYRISHPKGDSVRINKAVAGLRKLKTLERYTALVGPVATNHFTHTSKSLGFLEIKLSVDILGRAIDSKVQMLWAVKVLFVHVQAHNIFCLTEMLTSRRRPLGFTDLHIAIYGDIRGDYLGSRENWDTLDIEIAGLSEGMERLFIYPRARYAGSGTVEDLTREDIVRAAGMLKTAFEACSGFLVAGGFPTLDGK
ncbi:hypothetical protein C8J56DRAFT_885427 [Mycena floridula]|nr:hypothetical protein C8J56DRAFT_885427 [Mycena floridula]